MDSLEETPRKVCEHCQRRTEQYMDYQGPVSFVLCESCCTRYLAWALTTLELPPASVADWIRVRQR